MSWQRNSSRLTEIHLLGQKRWYIFGGWAKRFTHLHREFISFQLSLHSSKILIPVVKCLILCYFWYHSNIAIDKQVYIFLKSKKSNDFLVIFKHFWLLRLFLKQQNYSFDLITSRSKVVIWRFSETFCFPLLTFCSNQNWDENLFKKSKVLFQLIFKTSLFKKSIDLSFLKLVLNIW